MNGSSLVREATRARVRAVATRLGYVPHGAARSLITRRTHTLGVLLPDLYGEFYSEFMRGLDETAQGAGFHLLVTSVHADGEAMDVALRSLLGRVDGLVVMAPPAVASSSTPMPDLFPVVAVSGPLRHHSRASLSIANYEGACAMVEHFAMLGHRRIAIIRGAERNVDAAERLRGYRASVRAHGLATDAALELPGDFSEASGYAAAMRLLGAEDRPTAVFASNDGMALGALSAFREAGVRVPDDIAVGGFDDIPLARYVDPPLTTVRVDIRALGARAAELALEAVRHPDGPRNHETLPTTLVLRRSSGAQRNDPQSAATAAAAQVITSHKGDDA